jgi:hypothetical protein
MAKRRSEWQVQRPAGPLSYAFFISHVGEDAPAVRQLAAEIAALSSRGGRPALQSFLDIFSWPLSNDTDGVIKRFLRNSEFMMAWVTPAYLTNNRGWVWMELAYAALLEAGLNPSGIDVEFPFIVPIFRGVGVRDIERTPLLKYWQRKLLLPDEAESLPDIARKLVDFYDQEAAKRPAP